jgi:S1-C subfamily serine protease
VRHCFLHRLRIIKTAVDQVAGDFVGAAVGARLGLADAVTVGIVVVTGDALRARFAIALLHFDQAPVAIPAL